MKIFAQIVDGNIIRIINTDTLTKAKTLVVPTDSYEIVEITNSKKCENFEYLGRVYDKDNDIVLPAKTFPSWVLDQDNSSWKAPTPKPSESSQWDEESQSWS